MAIESIMKEIIKIDRVKKEQEIVEYVCKLLELKDLTKKNLKIDKRYYYEKDLEKIKELFIATLKEGIVNKNFNTKFSYEINFLDISIDDDLIVISPCVKSMDKEKIIFIFGFKVNQRENKIYPVYIQNCSDKSIVRTDLIENEKIKKEVENFILSMTYYYFSIFYQNEIEVYEFNKNLNLFSDFLKDIFNDRVNKKKKNWTFHILEEMIKSNDKKIKMPSTGKIFCNICMKEMLDQDKIYVWDNKYIACENCFLKINFIFKELDTNYN